MVVQQTLASYITYMFDGHNHDSGQPQQKEACAISPTIVNDFIGQRRISKRHCMGESSWASSTTIWPYARTIGRRRNRSGHTLATNLAFIITVCSGVITPSRNILQRLVNVLQSLRRILKVRTCSCSEPQQPHAVTFEKSPKKLSSLIQQRNISLVKGASAERASSSRSAFDNDSRVADSR